MRSKENILLLIVFSASAPVNAASLNCQSVFEDTSLYHRQSFSTVDELLSHISKQADKLIWTAPMLTSSQGWMRADETMQIRKDISKIIRTSVRLLEDLAAIPSQPVRPEYQKNISNLQKLLIDMELSFRLAAEGVPEAESNAWKLAEEYQTLINEGILDRIRSELMKDPLILDGFSTHVNQKRVEYQSEEIKLIGSYTLVHNAPEKTAKLDQIFKQRRFQNPLRFFQKFGNRSLEFFDRYTISISQSGLKIWKKGVVENTEKIESLRGEYVILDLDTDKQDALKIGLGRTGNSLGWEGLVISHEYNASRTTYDVTIMTPEGKLQTLSANAVLSVVVTRFRKDAYNFNQSYAGKKVRMRRATRNKGWEYSAPLVGTVIANDKKSISLRTSNGQTIEIPTIISENEWLEVKTL